MITFARMQRPHLSFQSILKALEVDTACIPLLERAPGYPDLLRAESPQAIFHAIHTIGGILNIPERADRLVEELSERINLISHKLKFITEENKPRVALFGDGSPMAVANDGYIGNLIQVAGGVLLPEPSVNDRNVDVLIVRSEKPVSELLTGLPQSLSRWSDHPALVQNRLYIIHHRAHLRAPGALIADDAEVLAEILYPNYFVFGRDEDVWMKFDWQ